MHGGSADCAAYFKQLGTRPHAINYGVSTFVMTIRSRTKTVAERLRQVERNLDEGALGVSHSLEYSPPRSRKCSSTPSWPSATIAPSFCTCAILGGARARRRG
jgi:hypothetical protein